MFQDEKCDVEGLNSYMQRLLSNKSDAISYVQIFFTLSVHNTYHLFQSGDTFNCFITLKNGWHFEGIFFYCADRIYWKLKELENTTFQ